MNLSRALWVGLLAGLAATPTSTVFAGPLAGETGPNLVTNGSFEATSSIAGSGWTPSGFLAEGFDYFIDADPADAQSGSNSFAGGGIGSPGFISQNISTVPGLNYNVHLWLANLSGFASDTEIQVLWGGNLVHSATNILGYTYNEIVIDPMATTPTTTLSIGLRDDAFFLNIDNISVRQVPEPATLGLLLCALAAAGLARRRRSAA